METTTLLQGIPWTAIATIILGSSLLSALFSGVISWRLSDRTREDMRYEKLYGPLKFHLLVMKLLVENREEVSKDIEEWRNVEVRIDLMQKHMSPLTIKWIEHRDNIRSLFEQFPGFIKEQDFRLFTDFMDGCIKREVIEEGKNIMALNENRTNKLLDAIGSFQDKLL
ncbi:MAG: hypothetical protein AAB472_02990 [Patescibacteria group bacterium]